jgi:hypothetical protein
MDRWKDHLVSSLDSIFATRRNVVSIIDDIDQQRAVMTEQKEAPLGGLSDLPNHAIMDRGRLIGLWEYDPEKERIAYKIFVRMDKALDEAIQRTEDYVRTQLGDARSFSLDSPKSRTQRIRHLEL